MSEQPCTLIVNHQQSIIFADRAAESVLGWNPEAMVGKRLQELLPQVGAEFFESLKENAFLEYPDLVLQTLHGEAVSVDCRFSPLAPEGVLITLQTQKKKSAQAHIFNAKYFFDANIIGIVFADINNRITDANDAFLNMLGYTREDFQSGRFGWWDLIPDEQWEVVNIALNELRTYGLCTPFELQFLGKDGQRKDVLAGAGFEEGSKEKLISFVLDISARKQAEQELVKGEKLFRIMADSSNLMIWLVTPDLTLKYLNKYVSDYVGVSMEEWGWWGKYVHPDDREELFQVLKAAIENKTQYLFKHRVLRHDGVYRWFFASGGPVFDEAGELLGYVGTAFDIDDLVVAQEELERDAKRLERSNKDLEHFATIASHDLQEPLRKIILFSDHLISTEIARLSPEGLDDFERIQRAAHKMQRLIHDLLDLSRVIRRGGPFVKVQLGELTKAVVAELAYTFPDAKERVSLKGDMTIDGDVNQLHQMMTQLLDNALKFHEPGKPSWVKVSIQPLDQAYCQICVEDNGIGMKPEHWDKIFDTFVRLHHGVEYPGTGIGLALAQKIVERHGGAIQVNSTPGEGSCLEVRLPIRDQDFN